MTKALLVIDVQNDYFPGGAFTLANADATLANVERAIARARDRGIPVILAQHLTTSPGPLLNPGTPGAAIHPRVLAAAPGAPIIVKHFADAFHQTSLAATLDQLGVTELVVCGMMTQNCVAFTAISKAAEPYAVAIIPEACTTVTEVLHHIALHGVSTRVPLRPIAEAL
jgi:nicotinamidase-related amidase